MTLEISHSSCSLARACPQKYKWHYIDGLRPIKKSNALTLGTIIHDAFDMYYKNFSFDDVTAYIRNTMDAQINSASLPDQEDLQVIKFTALGMWTNYPNLNLSEFQEIRSEEEFKVRLGNMRNVKFVGKSDRLVKKDGKWWIGELKTSGLPYQTFKNRMFVSDQVTAYVYAWKQLGYPVQGVIFDFIKKPLLRKGINEDCLSFACRIMKDYQERPDNYFSRHFEYRSDKDVERWLEDMKHAVRAIRRIWKGDTFRNTDNCWNYNSECPYKKICFADEIDQLTLDLYFEKTHPKTPSPKPQDTILHKPII